MKTIDEILDEWYPTIPDEEHNGLYARDKVKLIAQEFADQFRQPAVISLVYECKVCDKPFGDKLSLYEHYDEEHNKQTEL